MAASTTMSIIASSSAASANLARRAAEESECRLILKSYTPRDASVESMREYARCVYLINGDGIPFSSWQVIALKIFVLSLIVSAFLAAYLFYREKRDFAYATIGFLVGPSIVFAASVVILGLSWVIGG